MEKIKKNKKNQIWLMLMFLFISVTFLLVFSMGTSFIYEHHYVGWDSDTFMSMGKFASQGMTPYIDFFDHKGPFIIFIEWLGYGLGGRLGVFIIQSIFLTISLIGIYKLMCQYCTKKWGFVFTLGSLLFINMYFDNGNLTEEYCLPFIVWSLYLTIKENRWIWKGISLDYVIYGITFMVGAMTRLTNSLPVIVIVAIGVITTASNKQWKKVGKDLLWFVVGSLILLIPTLIYFIKVDALYEMINATFLYNFKHGFETKALTDIETINGLVLVIPLLIALFVGIETRVRTKEEPAKMPEMVLSMQSLVAFIMWLISRPYPHYYVVWIPTIMLSVAMLVRLYEVKKKQCILVAGVLMLVVLAKVVTASVDIYNTLNSNVCQIFDDEAEQIVSQIPEEDRDKVTTYMVKSRFYLVTDIMPCYRNFAEQGIHTTVDEEERQKFESDLMSMEAKYIIAGTYDGGYSQLIEQYYELEQTTNFFRVYVRK